MTATSNTQAVGQLPEPTDSLAPAKQVGTDPLTHPDAAVAPEDDPYQHSRPLTDDEYATLKADIKQHGVQEAVHVDEHGQILAGHHRARAAADLGIEYPRHIVPDLTEDQKHEYGVRLESLGRAKDIETKRWTALHLWRDPNVTRSKAKLGELLGVTGQTVANWIKADDEQRATEAEVNQILDLPPGDPPRATDSLGRQRPTSYRKREAPATNGMPADPETEQAAEVEQVADPSPTPPGADLDGDPPDEPRQPVVGDVVREIDSPERRRAQIRREVRAFRNDCSTFTRAIKPAEFSEGIRSNKLAAFLEDCDHMIRWLAAARQHADAKLQSCRERRERRLRET